MLVTKMAGSSTTGHLFSQMPQPMQRSWSMTGAFWEERHGGQPDQRGEDEPAFVSVLPVERQLRLTFSRPDSPFRTGILPVLQPEIRIRPHPLPGL